MKIKSIIFVILGCIFLALGTVGIFLPVLPTTPFYLLTLFFFANSSQRLHTWFTGTKLYKKHLEPFVEKRGMTMQTKLSIMISVTLLMGFGFFMMARKGIWIPCIILGVVWACHIVYFVFRVKTIKGEDSAEAEAGGAALQQKAAAEAPEAKADSATDSYESNSAEVEE